MTLDDSIQGFRLRRVAAMTCLARCFIAGALGWHGTDLTGCIRRGGRLGPGGRPSSAWRMSDG